MPYPVEPAQLPPDFDLTTLEVTPPDIDYTFHELVTELNTVPAVAGTITIPVDSAVRYAVGTPLYFAGHGIFRVTSRSTVNETITIENVTATAGIAIQIGTPFNVCALPPIVEEDAAANPIYDTLASSFSVPGVGNPVTIEVINGGWFVLNGIIFVENAGWFKITDPAASGSDKKCATLQIFTHGGATSGTITAGARVHAVSELPYIPDGATIVTSNATAAPGGGRMAVGTQFPQTPGVASVKILTGSTTPTTYAAPAGTKTVATVTFDPAFTGVPSVTLSAVCPNVASAMYPVVHLSELSATQMTIKLDIGASGSGADAYVNWIAIGV
jgi:hypothetical protein